MGLYFAAGSRNVCHVRRNMPTFCLPSIAEHDARVPDFKQRSGGEKEREEKEMKRRQDGQHHLYSMAVPMTLEVLRVGGFVAEVLATTIKCDQCCNTASLAFARKLCS